MIDFEKSMKPFLEKGAEYIDVRIADAKSENIQIEDSRISSIQNKEDFSYGIRVFYRGAWGFVYGNKKEKMDDSLAKAWKIAKVSSKKVKKKFSLVDYKSIKDSIKMKVKKDIIGTDVQEKIDDLLNYDALLNRNKVKHRSVSASFVSLIKNFSSSHQSDITEMKSGFGFRLAMVGREGDRVFRASERIGKVSGYEHFEKINKEKLTSDAYRKFLHALEARTAPGGRFPVVIDNGLCEVFFHEAVGHACEADAVLEGMSVLKSRPGKKIAPDAVTLIDTPKVRNEFGYYRYDDEGMPAQDTVLIENGVLKSFMQSKETASLIGMEPTGNGRAENPKCVPYPRMSNTYLKAGSYTVRELFEGMRSGIYAKGSSGGIVEPNNGNFLFNAEEAFLIENGKITKPLKDVSLAGNILDTLKKIEKVGKDSKPTFWGGHCGKKGQFVPVGGKAPHIRISKVMVGGQK